MLGAALRLWAAFVAPPDGVLGDEWAYWRRARTILATGDPGTAWQPPGQAYLIALSRSVAPGSFAPVRAINVAAYLLAAAAVIALAARPSRALAPSAVLALHPVLIAFSGYLLSESVFLALVLWAFCLQWRDTPASLAAAGILWGLASLVREIAILLFLVSALFQFGGRLRKSAVWMKPAVLGLAFAAAIAPWVVRNALVLGAPVFTTSSGFNLWAGNQDEIDGAYAWNSEQLGRYYASYEAFAPGELERDAAARSKAFAFIADEQPRWLVRKPWMGLTHLLEPDNYALRRARAGHYGELGPVGRRLIAFVTLAGEAAVVVWAIGTLLSLRASRPRNAVIGMILVAAAIHVLMVANSRHRLPLELLVLMTAGCRFKPFAPRRVGIALLATALLVAIGLTSPGRARLLGFLSGS